MYAKVEVWQNRVAGLLAIILLCIQPLYLNANRYMRLTWHKFIFFVVYMAIILLAVIIIWIVRASSKPRLGPRERPYLTDWVVIGYAIITLLSALLSPYPQTGIVFPSGSDALVIEGNVWIGLAERYDGLLTQMLYVAIFFIIAHWYKPRMRHFVLFGVSAILVALIGILQFYGMDFLKLWPNHIPEYHVENFYRIFFRSTLGNVNIVSTYVCVAILLSGFLFIKTKTKWRYLWLAGSGLNFWLMELAGADSGRVGLLVATLLAIPIIVESLKTLGRALILFSSWIAVYTLQKLFYEVVILNSRTFSSLLPFIAAVVVLLAAGVIFAKRGKELGRDDPVRWKLGIVLIVVCLAAGITGVEILGRSDAEAGNTGIVYEMREIMHGNIQDRFGTSRVYIWRNALEAYPNRPLIGTGPDTFAQAFPREAQSVYGEFYENAHNEYVQILICQGILGLICYLVFLVATLAKSVPKAFRNPMIAAALAAFAGYCVQAFFNLSLPIVSQFIWLFAGMLANKTVRETGLG